MSSVINKLKKESVAVIAFLAALISCFFVPVTNYISYVDTDLIGILFGLMAVVAGFAENNVFKVLSDRIVRAVGDMRKLSFMLVFTVFFLSMLITNDVALIAFVPFTIMLYNKIDKSPVYVITLQTVAANMGSAFTPFGNPQNLYLFSASGMSCAEFFSLTARVTIISFILLLICVLLIKKEPVTINGSKDYSEIQNPKYLILYGILFILCILSVFKIVDTISVFASVCVVIAIIQPSLFGKVDYGLLFTFVCFFIFVGNIKNLPQLTQSIQQLIVGREFASAVILSQVISNVPAAVMLSAFSDNYKEMILGTDIGGLGTLIASMASLISYKSYANSENADTKRFIGMFTLINIVFLAVMIIYAKAFMIPGLA